MPVTLPTNYDWSSTVAPTGGFGVESIPGSESVLGNLSGIGALGTEGILNFANNYQTGRDSLSNLTRLAGNVGALFGGTASIEDYVKSATKALKTQSKKTTRKIDKRIKEIYPKLTGMTGEEALAQYYDNFADTISDVASAARADLGITPDISAAYDRLNTRVQNIQNQYSLANRLGGYERLALDPPVVSMDVSSIRDTADWVDPTSGQMRDKYTAMYDYSSPQTKQFLYGARNTADAIGRYYNASGDVSGLMSYGGLA
jgi:hypothetical protein